MTGLNEDAIDARAVAEFRTHPEPGGMPVDDFAAQLKAERGREASAG